MLAAVLAVLVLVTGGGWFALRDGAGPAAGAASQQGVPQDQPGPVLLVPGYGGGTGGLQVLADRLRAAGRDATVVALPGDGTGDLRAQADVLNSAVQAYLADGAPSVDIVGYSAGGVVARIWAAEHGGGMGARRIVTLGSPHRGTSIASLAAALLPESCPAACRQLVRDSALLTGLPPLAKGPVWTSIWTAQDDVVTPPDSAVLAGALNVRLQDVCPDDAARHGDLPTDPLVDGLVRRALGVAPLALPGPGQCGPLRAAA